VLNPAAGGVDATARFGWDRLTPGALGLELTTLLALAAVGLFNFFLLGQVIAEPGDPQVDRMAADVADGVAFGALTEAAKLLTDIGSFAATTVLVLATALWAALRRRWVDAGALVAGHALALIAVHVAKDAYGRPRPENGLVEATLAAYPSGHSLYAVSLIACATVLVRAGAGWALRFAVVAVAIGAVVVVGSTRVYLRVHFLTDVLGGIALGLAIWALVGIAALFAGHVRHNGEP
jgi:undecaprenyl-diphosphatase